MTDDVSTELGRSPAESGDEHEHPIGSLFVLMIFLIVLAGMWGAMYVIYLGR